jgi:hypothetical protein
MPGGSRSPGSLLGLFWHRVGGILLLLNRRSGFLLGLHWHNSYWEREHGTLSLLHTWTSTDNYRLWDNAHYCCRDESLSFSLSFPWYHPIWGKRVHHYYYRQALKCRLSLKPLLMEWWFEWLLSKYFLSFQAAHFLVLLLEAAGFSCRCFVCAHISQLPASPAGYIKPKKKTQGISCHVVPWILLWRLAFLSSSYHVSVLYVMSWVFRCG